MAKFKGYEVVDNYPEEGGLKGYFYVIDDDLKNNKGKTGQAYRDVAFIKHKDFVLHLLDIKKGERILDVGCFQGSVMVYCGLLSAEVYGIDISPDLVERANKYLEKYALKGKAIVGDARSMGFADNYFDKVISSDFFEHLSPQDNIKVLKEIKRVLKPAGMAVIKTPNLTYLKLSRVYKMLKCVLTLKNPFNVVIANASRGNHPHIGLSNKSKMARLIQEAGFLNFKFHYDRNSKIERFSFSLAELTTEIPLLRDALSEDLIAVVYKPVILSFFPE